MSSQSPKRKSSKGTVQIKISNERLQVIFRFAGKRYYLSTGFSDRVANPGQTHLNFKGAGAIASGTCEADRH